MSRSSLQVRLDDVVVEFSGRRALDGVSLEMQSGEHVALVGLSGAGKTTLLNTLTGMIAPGAGTVSIEGSVLSALSPRQLRVVRSSIGFVHQDFSLVPGLRVVQNVISGRLGSRSFLGGVRDVLFPSREAITQAHEILESVGIHDKLFERVDRLSGGERQRVAIARALFQRPRILLADEPVSSVDPARARATIALLGDICTKNGITLCVSLHNLDLAREFFPRLIALRAGKVAFDKSPAMATSAEFEDLYRFTDAVNGTNSGMSSESVHGTGSTDMPGARFG